MKEAVEDCKEVSDDCVQPGLQALGNDSVKVKPRYPGKLRGSVDFDGCLEELYPNDPRWDYGIDYDGAVYYVEVHPASSSNVDEVIAKAEWFRAWKARTGFGPVDNEKGYWWVATSGVHILPRSQFRRRLADAGTAGPVPVLPLPSTVHD